jgi:DNA-directed RNA polymerase subunit RPC12/RpoP
MNMEYVCFGCGESIGEEELKRRVRCPYCGGKVLYKKRPNIVKTVKAR